jgi:hypothetical protein
MRRLVLMGAGASAAAIGIAVVVIAGGDRDSEGGPPTDEVRIGAVRPDEARIDEVRVVPAVVVDAAPAVPEPLPPSPPPPPPPPDAEAIAVAPSAAASPKQVRPPTRSPASPIVVPAVLEANRTSGSRTIVPDPSTRLEIARSGKVRVEGTYKICLDAQGEVFSVSQVKSTGFPDYDGKIASEMRQWTYKPYVLDGRVAPICAAVSVGYSPAAAPPAAAPLAAPPPSPPSPPQQVVSPACTRASFASVLQARSPDEAMVQAALVRLRSCEPQLSAEDYADLQQQLIKL